MKCLKCCHNCFVAIGWGWYRCQFCGHEEKSDMKNCGVKIKKVDELIIDMTLLDTGVPIDVIFNGERVTIVRVEDDVIHLLGDTHDHDEKETS